MSYNAFAITPANNKDDKNDATGAFIPGAQKFAYAYKGAFRKFNNLPGESKKNFLKALTDDAPGGLDLFAYFGHGYHTQLGSAGIITDKDTDQLADILKKKLNPGAIVILYACFAGVENGFSTTLQKKLGGWDIWVYGHATLGHSFANPDVTEVQERRNPGFRRVYPGSSPLRGPWNEALHYTDMWLRFPVMWDEYIDRELYAIRLLGKWKVSAGGKNKTYVFSWDKKNEIYTDLASINKNPTGTVKEQIPGGSAAAGDEGTWEIDRQLEISWKSGARETWQLPLNVLAQTGIGAGGSIISAKRETHTLPGKSQT
jgi:hypothetical protein